MLLDIPKYLQDSESVYVCVIDSAGKYTYANDLFKRKYSFIASNLIGYYALATIYEGDHPLLMQAIDKLKKSPESTVKVALRKPASRENKMLNNTSWELSSFSLRDGMPESILCLGLDVTINDYQVDLLKQFPDSFAIINHSGYIVNLNLLEDHPMFQRKESLEGEQLESLFAPETASEAWGCFEKVLAEGETISCDHTYSQNLKPVYYQTAMSTISYNGSIHLLLVMRNVTAEKLNQEILEISLKRSKDIWESITDMFHFINKKWEIEYANSAWEKFFGFTDSSQYLGKTIWEVFPEMTGDAIENCFRKAMKSGSVCNFEGFYNARNKWFSMRIFPSSRGISVYNRDITELKTLESKERLLETRLKDVWEKLIDGYISLDNAGKVLYANHAFITLFNLKEAEINGKSLGNIIPELYEKEMDFNVAVHQAIETGEVQKRICFFKERDIWINTAFFPTDEGVDIYMQDISHAERMRNAMNDLSFMTSHELRHEYAKLHSVINLMTLSGDDEKYLLKEANKSLIQINSLISVMNDKLTFNRDNSMRADNNGYIEFDEVVLIDDDHVINFINARVIRLLFDNVKVKSFSHADKALDYLKEFDKEGKKLLFIDLNMPGFDGWDFLESYRQLPVRSRIYILTSSINPRDIERSMDYSEVVKFLTKPLSVELLEYERIRPLSGSVG